MSYVTTVPDGPLNLGNETTIALWVPFPPSVNSLFRDKVGTGPGAHRPRSERYRRWHAEACQHLMIQKRRILLITEKVVLQIFHSIPDKRERDASNYIKAIEDALVHMQIIINDNIVHFVSSSWEETVKEGSLAQITLLRNIR